MSKAADESCLFCRIIAGDIPATIVAESEHAIAIRDVNPQAPTHVLILPRRHIDDASRVDDSDGHLLGEMLALSRHVAGAEGIDGAGYRLVFNVGRDGGNTVSHLHLHVLGGRAMSWPPG